MSLTVEEKCPQCGGILTEFVQEDPFSFNTKLNMKKVCTSCGKVIQEYSSTTTSNSYPSCPVCGEPFYVDRTTAAKTCKKCGYSEITLPHTITNPLVNEPDNQTSGLMGWVCPKCGRALSPYTDMCPCSNKWEITCNANGTATSTTISDGINQYLGYSRKDKLGYE